MDSPPPRLRHRDEREPKEGSFMASIRKMPAALFAQELGEALARGDGYIMGATGQDPRKWAASSHWFTQYSGAQREKALYWRAHAKRVWDCNGLAEGLYKDYAGKDGDRPVFISLESSDGKVETNSLTWKLPMCIKVHNAILDVYNDIVFKKNFD